jgi:hypothetical protein
MKRWSVILGAAAICVAVSSQAQASYSIIKWTSGFCQVWDNALPTKPFPGDYKVISRRPYKTFEAAMSAKIKMIGKGCW